MYVLNSNTMSLLHEGLYYKPVGDQLIDILIKIEKPNLPK